MSRTEGVYVEAAPTDTPRTALRTWLAIVSLSLGAFVVVATEFLPIGVLPLVADELGVSVGTAGLMVLIPGLVAGVAAPLVVVWSSRLRRNVLVISLGALLVASNVIAYLAPDFATIVVARVLVGVALGGFWAVAPTLGFKLAGPTLGARATSIILAGISAGTVIGLPAGQLIGEMFGWRAVFGGAAVLSVVVLAAQIALLPRIPASTGLKLAAFASVFRSPMARVGVISAVLIFTGQFAASTFLTPFLESETDLTPAVITFVFFAYGVAGIFGTLIGGVLIAKNHRATLVGVALVLGTVLIILPILSFTSPVVVTLFVLWGLLWGIVPLMLQTWLIASLPAAPEAASAVLVTTTQIAIALGALLGGLLMDAFGPRLDFIVAGAIVAIASLVPLIKSARYS